MLPFETRHRRREIRMKISFWMRKGIVAMKIMEMAFQHNFGWRREGNLINHDPSLNNKKKGVSSPAPGNCPHQNSVDSLKILVAVNDLVVPSRGRKRESVSCSVVSNSL